VQPQYSVTEEKQKVPLKQVAEKRGGLTKELISPQITPNCQYEGTASVQEEH